MTIKLFEQHDIPFDISTLFVTNVYSSEHKEIIINPEVITEMFYKGEQTMKNNEFKLKHIVVDYTLQV